MSERVVNRVPLLRKPGRSVRGGEYVLNANASPAALHVLARINEEFGVWVRANKLGGPYA